jgi:hypothetical protein
MTAEEVKKRTLDWIEHQYDRVIEAIDKDGQKGTYSCIRFTDGHALLQSTIDRLVGEGYTVRETQPRQTEKGHDTYYFICWESELLGQVQRWVNMERFKRQTDNYKEGYKAGLRARPWYLRLFTKNSKRDWRLDF